MKKLKIRKGTDKTPYELWFGRAPYLQYYRIFESRFYIKRDDDIGKFDSRSDERMLLLGSTTDKNKNYMQI